MSKSFQSVCVYCGSSSQAASDFFRAADKLGQILASEHVSLVYGAGAVGLMGQLADSTLRYGGTVLGIIPRFMYDENWFHPNLSELLVVESMHERKEKMSAMADALIALPGGVGTMEELLEVITWKQLGLINKPIVIVNVNNYYTPLLDMMKKTVDNKFMRSKHLDMWMVVDDVNDVIPALRNSLEWDENCRKFAAM